MMTPLEQFDEIVAHGNRGHVGFLDNNRIVCDDGFTLSVIAGGGTYCLPKPATCTCALPGLGNMRATPPYAGQVEHAFAGPYTHVEVMADPVPDYWHERYGGSGVYSCVPVEAVRVFIESHYRRGSGS